MHAGVECLAAPVSQALRCHEAGYYPTTSGADGVCAYRTVWHGFGTNRPEPSFMRDIDLLQTALGLPAPWVVSGSRFDAVARRLDIDITFAKSARFACPDCGTLDCPVHDTETKAWRH